MKIVIHFKQIHITARTGLPKLIEQMLSLQEREFGRVEKVGLPVLVEVLTLERDAMSMLFWQCWM